MNEDHQAPADRPRRAGRLAPPANVQPVLDRASAELRAVLESASRLQELVPDAVLVGGSAAALYAAHRDSNDHDHVVSDLRDRFDLAPGPGSVPGTGRGHAGSGGLSRCRWHSGT